MDTSCKECDVYLAIIIKNDNLDNNENSYVYSDYNTVKIIDHVYGKNRIDTLIVFQGIGDFCLGNLVSRNIGDTILLTGEIYTEITIKNGQYIEVPTLTITSCNVQSLVYRNGFLYGSITKDEDWERRKLLHKLFKFIPNFILAKHKKSSISYSQRDKIESEEKISLKKLKRKLVRKFA